MAPPPAQWPDGVAYLAANELHCDVEPPAGEDIGMPHVTTPSPVFPVSIALITDPSHPVANSYGLFAAAPIPPHTLVLNYMGQIHLQTTFPDSDYAVTYYGPYSVDATFAGNEARFINDYCNIGSRPNVAFDTYRDCDGAVHVGVWTLNVPIARGEEILGNYGRAFWRARGVRGVVGPDWDDDWDS
ncbi:hypothetical protein H310_00778 [Aphanomyces invadans]|uniref:SET domain-containing protein n=1 Tax=Aphanomyces invadans TaxID=157072 RepID=A0A024UVE1_9STRA|nr:hypothetical protein H310_00778 [Aphanomyces invadans]ETW10486.1 hypothetical protein H310_00778 [Aphanomyces invadans]|eukprot:XP_008861897.1 hypothetical protein H310_00778 [Aphanomyces invadans]